MEEALKLLVRLKRVSESILDLQGKLTSWEGNIDEMRRDRLEGSGMRPIFVDSSVWIDFFRG